jgi:hypothetical protein
MNRITTKRRLERAGYAHVAGWLPDDEAAKVAEQIEQHREEAERAASVARPIGRPRKDAGGA